MTREPCAACGGSGKCPTCKGAKEAKVTCPRCRGRGSFVAPNARIAYLDVLGHLGNLANEAAMRERGMVYADGQWLDRVKSARRERQRQEEFDYFARMVESAEKAKSYEEAAALLDKAVARYPQSSYTGDVMQVKAMIQTDVANTTPKDILGPEQVAAAAEIAATDIPQTVTMALDAARRETNAPLFCVKGANPPLPSRPLKWTIGAPVLLGRSARVPATVERASRSGFAVAEPWVFFLVYDSIDWKLWHAAAP